MGNRKLDEQERGRLGLLLRSVSQHLGTRDCLPPAHGFPQMKHLHKQPLCMSHEVPEWEHQPGHQFQTPFPILCRQGTQPSTAVIFLSVAMSQSVSQSVKLLGLCGLIYKGHMLALITQLIVSKEVCKVTLSSSLFTAYMPI